jgi:hypothetical protein
MAFVLIQHRAPDHSSLLTEIIQRWSSVDSICLPRRYRAARVRTNGHPRTVNPPAVEPETAGAADYLQASNDALADSGEPTTVNGPLTTIMGRKSGGAIDVSAPASGLLDAVGQLDAICTTERRVRPTEGARPEPHGG